MFRTQRPVHTALDDCGRQLRTALRSAAPRPVPGLGLIQMIGTRLSNQPLASEDPGYGRRFFA